MGQLKLGDTFQSNPLTEVGLMGAGVPVILPSNGTVATSGVITLATALPTVYSDAWVWLPAGAVVGGAAGLYYTEFTSTTVGQVYTPYAYPAGPDFSPYDPAESTHIAAVGSNSAYTQTTGTDLVLMSETIPGGILGKTGQVTIKAIMSTPSNANAKTPKILFGSTYIHNASITTSLCVNIDKELTNRGKETKQLGTPLSVLGHGASASAAVYASENTKDNVSLKFSGQLAVATDYLVYEAAIVTLLAS